MLENLIIDWNTKIQNINFDQLSFVKVQIKKNAPGILSLSKLKDISPPW